MNNIFQKQIDDQIRVVDEKFDAMENPYLYEAKKALNLRKHDFSVSDHELADRIINRQKFEI